MEKDETKRAGRSYADVMWEKAKIPSQLWHYTDSAGLLGIATSKSLWCTEYRYVNDRQEMATFATQLQGRLRETLKAFLRKEDVDLVAKLSNMYTTWNVFICSFCKEPDRNEHWQQYARRAGYALGFDPYVLRSLAQAQGFVLAPLFYGTNTALDIASAVLQDHPSLWESFKSPLSTDDVQTLSRTLCDLILHFAPFFKDASFKREEEWRLAKVTGLDGDGKMLFRASKSLGLVNYYEFKFEAEPGKIPTNLIPRVVIGPGNDTVGWPRGNNPSALLEKSGLMTDVSESKSSLRFHD
jgi:Protein of unknown function (DUF2971)